MCQYLSRRKANFRNDRVAQSFLTRLIGDIDGRRTVWRDHRLRLNMGNDVQVGHLEENKFFRYAFVENM